MHRVIEHLRLFSREQEADVRGPLVVADAVDGAVQMVGAQLRAHGVLLEVGVAADLPPLTGDTFRLEQVLVNLVNNARDAVEERHRDAPEAPMRVQLHAGLEDGAIVVEIEDNGVGMEPEELERVFDPFYTTKAPNQGTGLGLAIAHGIVTQLGGRVETNSIKGEGTCMRVVLPVEAQPA
ncbi:hypothetical protein HN371_00965 [Candidatus Poribacteria bacterium]|jgi:C4-dicarboxylate-specific signal transduction histidine kinase|nr:hypothetical protein [Candidatus Poribacteria bacterium]